MFEKQILRQMFSQASDVPFAVTYWDQNTDIFGNGKPRFTIRMHDKKILDMLNQDIEVAFGDAYVKGKWDVDGDISDIIAAAAAALSKQSGRGKNTLIRAAGKIAQANGRRSQKQQSEDVERHYDLGNDFYKLWLDESMCYSCAYFENADDTLESAQRQKIDHSLRKLRLKAGESLLDIGSGWGALLVRAAVSFNVRALGITLSKEQYSLSCDKIRSLDVADRVDVRLQNYQTLANSNVTFDKIVSIGMIEHVGKPHLPEFVESVAKMLRPGGLALLHFITTPHEGQFDAWLDKHIFPGAYIPTVPEMADLINKNGMRILDVENLRPHYQMTLDRWTDRFEAQADKIRQMFDEEFVRMWRLYLRGSSASFRIGTVELHQILVSKEISDDLPMTRKDLYA